MIYKRGAVCWYKFGWTIKHEDGKHENYVIRKSARTSSQRKAREVEEEHRRALRLSTVHPADPWPKPSQVAPQVPTLKGFAPQFLDYVAVHRKPGTVTFYTVCINRVLRFAPLADLLMSEATSENIAKYARWRRSTQPQESLLTVNGELRTLRRMFRLAHEWGIIAHVPSIHELPGGKGRDRVIAYSEEARYLASGSATLRDVATLAVDSGLRPNSELFSLMWADVHLETSEDAPQGFLHVRQGKTDAATRNIPLTPRVRQMLLRKRHSRGASEYVFPGPGNSGHLTSVQHPHSRAVQDAGLEPFEFYCWRHTFGPGARRAAWINSVWLV